MKNLIILISLFLFSFAAMAEIKIVIIGDSLTEGYGLDKEDAYPSLLEKKLNEKSTQKFKIINGGVSGATSASGLSRLKWFLKAKPSVIMIALGGNDGLRGLKIEETKKNLEDLIVEAKKQNLKVILCEMQIPTNYGEDYRRSFNQMYTELAKKHQINFLPFMLEGIGGVKELNLADGIHPNKKGHEKIVDNILPHLDKLL
jgi:acyl-CoA thioesterase I